MTDKYALLLIANTGYTTTTVAASVAQLGLAKSIGIVTKAIIAQAGALLANPIGAIAATAVVVWGVSEAYKALTISVEEHQQMLEDAKSSYNDTASEIKNLNSQLTDTQNKISELEGYDKLSFTDQQELDRLKIQNDELQRELDLQNQLKDAKQQEVNKEFVDTMEADAKGKYKSVFEEEVDAWGGISSKSIDRPEYDKEQLKLYKISIENYKKYQTELNQAKADGNKKAELKAQKQVDIYKKQSEDASKYLNQRVSELTNEAKGVTKDESTKPFLDSVNNLRDSWAIAFNDMSGDTDAWAQSQKDAFNRISNEDEFSSLVSDAKNIGSSLDLTQEKYKDFLQALIDSGFISDTSSDSLEKVVNAINDIGDSASNTVPNVTSSFDDLVDSVSSLTGKYESLIKAQDEYKDSGTLTIETLSSLVHKYGDVGKEQTGLYLAGMISASELFSNLQKSYSSDVNTYRESVAEKLSNSTEFFKNLLNNQSQVVKDLAKSYNIDLQNVKTVEQLKEKIRTDALSNFAKNYAKTLTGMTVTEQSLLVMAYEDNNTARAKAAKETLDIIQASADRLNSITFDATSFDPKKFSFDKTSKSSKKETELYIADIDKLYDAELRLQNIQDEISDQNIFKDFADSSHERISNIQKEILLYKQEQAAIKNLNAERTKQIQENVSKLNSQGFNVLYNAVSNRLAITNMEHINDIVGKTTDKTNELRKSAESLIDTTQNLNEKNIQGMQTWYSSLKSIKDEYRDLQSVVSNTVNKVFDKVSDLLNKEKKAYETQKSNLETVASTVTSYISTYIESLQEENDELDKQISLQEKLEALDKARTQRNKRIFKSGEGFVWSSDSSAVNDAQQEYDSELRQNSLDKKIEDLRDYADAWENAVDSYDRSANRALTKSILGKHWRSDVLGMNYRSIRNFKNEYTDVLSELDSNVYGSVAYQIQNLEDLQDEWKDSVDRASDTSTDYESVLDFISDYEDSNYKTRLSDLSDFVSDAISEYRRLARAAESASNISYVDYDSGSGRSSHGKSYSSDKDYSAAIKNAKTRDEVEELAHKRDNKIKGDHVKNVKSTDSFVKDWEKKHGYANGGVVDYTGLAMVHGGQEHEVMFNGNAADKLWSWVQNTDLLSQSAANMLMANSLSVGNNIEPSSNQDIKLSIGDINLYGVNDSNGLADAIVKKLPSQILQKFYKK